jgi:hypothetical protein
MGAHESENRWKHEGHEGFRQVRASRGITILRHMFWCIMFRWALNPFYPSFYMLMSMVYKEDLNWL